MLLVSQHVVRARLVLDWLFAEEAYWCEALPSFSFGIHCINISLSRHPCELKKSLLAKFRIQVMRSDYIPPGKRKSVIGVMCVSSESSQ